MKLIISLLSVFTLSLCFITGCNTAKGFGQDMQAGGQAIQKAAHDSTSNTKQ